MTAGNSVKLISDTVEISEMSEHDLLEVVEIEESCGLSRWGWEAYYTELAQGDRRLMLVARDSYASSNREEQRVVAFIASRYTAGELHINNVAVRPEYRRRGIGKALMDAVLKAAASSGAHKALLEVRASNLYAQSLYLRCGFRYTGRRRNYYKEPVEDALLMALDL